MFCGSVLKLKETKINEYNCTYIEYILQITKYNYIEKDQKYNFGGERSFYLL